jgi:hypothetical protein
MDDLNPGIVVVDGVDHAVVAATRRIQTRKIVAQRFNESAWVVNEWAEDELYARCRDLLG